MKKSVLSLFALLLCVALTACGASSYDSAALNAVMEASGSSDGGFDFSYKAESKSIDEVSMLAADEVRSDIGTTKAEKLVYTANLTLETEDLETASDALHQKIEALGGIIVSENAYNLNRENYRGRRSLNMTARIPQENYDAFLNGLGDICNVAGISRNVENLTERYYDNETRLKSYRIQEERLLSMLENAKNVSEMLEIESRLCDVQYHIESLTNTQRTIDNDVRYATFYLSLDEVAKYTTPAPKTFGDRLGETLKESGEIFVEVAEGLLFIFIYALPYLLVVAVIVTVVIIIVKASRKKKKKKEAPQD